MQPSKVSVPEVIARPTLLDNMVTKELGMLWYRWSGRREAKKKAEVKVVIGKLKNGKDKYASRFRCAFCKELFEKVHVDHRVPVICPFEGFIDIGTWVRRKFVPASELQVLCINCHINIKTKAENKYRFPSAACRSQNPLSYGTWSNMNDRCHNPSATGYKYYGAKGISVCPEWRRGASKNPFIRFVEDMGARQEGYTLDRIDYTKDYSKENCRWATATEQARNTSANNWIEYDGKLLVLQEWGELLGIIPNTILTRLRRGWPVGEALGIEKKSKSLYTGRLTPDDFLSIKDKLSEGMTIRGIARDLEMDESQISRMVSKFNLRD